MRIQALYALSCLAFGLFAVPSLARAQDSDLPNMLILVEAVHPGEVSAAVGPTVEQPAPPFAPSPATTSGQNKVPPVEHTGLATLVRDVYHDFAAFPLRESTWIILGVGGGLALVAHPFDDDVNARLASSSSADKFWKPGHIIGGPVMYAVPVALYIGGRYIVPHATNDDQTNKWSHLGLDLIRAEILTEAIVEGLKVSVQRTRPDGSNNLSFPSGHAASTFALASVLERHLGYRFAWPTVAIATYVATSRLHDNVHFLSDVVFGAAVGTAAGWTVVGRHGRTNYAFNPTPVPGGMAFTVSRNFQAN